MKEELLTTNRKALTINLDAGKYGTFAEIGAGQEVARHFFHAGGASGTIAKTISAYDMKFSDEIYGKAARYVSRERLLTMIAYEYRLLEERLAESRGTASTFFAFANTIAATSYRNENDGYGWMGIRFQFEPGGKPGDIILHTRLFDKENLAQQQALGILGVNLIYGAFYYRDTPEALIQSLTDNLHRDRFEIDVVKFRGPGFEKTDNRLMSLELVQQGLTHAVMFGRSGEVLQPSEVLYKKALFVQRGSFRPLTRVNVDMMRSGLAQFEREPQVGGQEVLPLMEITMHNLLTDGTMNPRDFLDRVDILSYLDYPVLVSNYPEYFRLAAYFRRYTRSMIGIVLGINHLVEIFNEKYYENLDGGILESFGRLFKNTVKLYAYPMRHNVLTKLRSVRADPLPGLDEIDGKDVITAENLRVPERVRRLYQYLLENRHLESLNEYDRNLQQIFSPLVLEAIQTGRAEWEPFVPEEVATLIKERRLFGYSPPAAGTDT